MCYTLHLYAIKMTSLALIVYVFTCYCSIFTLLLRP